MGQDARTKPDRKHLAEIRRHRFMEEVFKTDKVNTRCDMILRIGAEDRNNMLL